jgi:hypothetical protein
VNLCELSIQGNQADFITSCICLEPGNLCSENRSVMGFNLIWLTDKVKELNEELDAMLK